MSLTLAEAIALIDRGMVKAKDIKVRVSLAIVDEFGQAIQIDRMDGASLMTPDIAQAKALTAVNFGRPTSQLAAMTPDTLRTLAGTVRFNVVPLPGGVPILRDGNLAGAIGVSGATPAQDEEIAGYAIAV